MAHDRSPTRPVLSRTSSRQSQNQETTHLYHRPSSANTKSHKRGGASIDLNEQSPLLSPIRVQDWRNSEDLDTPTGLLDWNDEEVENSKSVFYLFILTLSIGG